MNSFCVYIYIYIGANIINAEKLLKDIGHFYNIFYKHFLSRVFMAFNYIYNTFCHRMTKNRMH